MKDSIPPTEKRWLERKSWADNYIHSNARNAHWFLWGFCLLWNLLTLPLLFQFGEIWQKVQREPVTAFVFVFPLVGLALIAAAVHATRQKKRFGLTPLVMDPFPGSLGGHVGGIIDTRIPFDQDRNFSVSISCIHSYVSGSGKNRSRSESIKWHSDGACHTESDGSNTRLKFRFSIPDDLPVSDPVASGDYHLWRLRVVAEMPGPDFDRNYEIPVFDTGALHSDIEHATESHSATVDTAMDGVNSITDIRPIPGGIEAWFPALQRPAQGIIALVFGLVFGGIGVGVGMAGESRVLAGVFTLVGSLIAAYGTFYLGKSLRVFITRDGIRSRRFLFGYPITTRQMPAANVRQFEIRQGATMQSGKKTTVYYQVFASGSGTKPFPVAERLTSRAEAELLQDTYQTYLGRSKLLR